jgi:ribosomal protein S18 acetylase RimI-like enzyme
LLDIRPMRPTDLYSVAALHAVALPTGFFAQLGSRFLRAYYGTFIDSPHAVALTATMDGNPVGMIVGPTRTREHYRWIARRRASRLALVGIAALVPRPRLLLVFFRTRPARYVRALRRMTDIGATPNASTSPDVAVLSHVAVDGGLHGTGVGRKLVSAFLEELQARSVEEVRLITAADGGAAGFYERVGWDRLTERTAADGSHVVEFRFHPLS